MSKELKVSGQITKILPIDSGVSNAGKEWKKINFVLNTGAEYSPEVCFQIFGDEKVEKFLQYNNEGDSVDVLFNVSSREFKGKYYHNLDAWRVSAMEVSNGAQQSQEPADMTPEDESEPLPF